MKRVLAALAMVLGIVTAGASSASAIPYGEEAVLVPETVVAGQPFTVTFAGCALGETVAFAVTGSTDEASCTGAGGGTRRLAAPTGGTASGTLTAPTTPGTYEVTATGLTSGQSDTATITVVAAGTGADDDDGAVGGELPATGSGGTDTKVWVAGSALLAGLGLTGVAWFRRHRPATA